MQSWPGVWPIIYEDSINHNSTARNFLPRWYLLENTEEIIDCVGLIMNNFISTEDIYPWINALFIEEKHRGSGYGALLMDKAKRDTRKVGFEDLYLCTELIGYSEKYGL